MAEGRWPVASGDADFAPYLDGKPEASVALFWRFTELARAAGPVIFELQNSTVILRGTRRIFASVRVTDAGLAGHLNLTSGHTSPATQGSSDIVGQYPRYSRVPAHDDGTGQARSHRR